MNKSQRGKKSNRIGNEFKYLSKKWLTAQGYCCEYIERYQRIVDGRGRVFNIKRDLFGSDLLAFNAQRMVFVQVKVNKKHVAEAIREFAKYPFPAYVYRWILVWTPGKKDPEIIDVEKWHEEKKEEGAIRARNRGGSRAGRVPRVPASHPPVEEGIKAG